MKRDMGNYLCVPVSQSWLAAHLREDYMCKGRICSESGHQAVAKDKDNEKIKNKRQQIKDIKSKTKHTKMENTKTNTKCLNKGIWNGGEW